MWIGEIGRGGMGIVIRKGGLMWVLESGIRVFSRKGIIYKMVVDRNEFVNWLRI